MSVASYCVGCPVVRNEWPVVSQIARCLLSGVGAGTFSFISVALYAQLPVHAFGDAENLGY
eukprot:6204960-Pleurochrysis_carterae.AAC.2